MVERAEVPHVVELLAEIGAAEGAPIIAIRSLGGAVSRIPWDATAYAHRGAELMVMTTSVGPAAVLDAAGPALDRIWARLAPHLSGACANFLSTATPEDVAAVYPTETHARLAAIKRRYDPDNLFAGNHNVTPQ